MPTPRKLAAILSADVVGYAWRRARRPLGLRPACQPRRIILAFVVAASMLVACGADTTSHEIGGAAPDGGDPYGCGGPYSKAELDEAWAHFLEVGQRGSDEAVDGNWAPFVERWGNLFTEDVTYVDHQFGVMHGREEVKAWMAGLMEIKPYDTEMVFAMDWVVIDYERSWVNYKLWNRMRDAGDGCVHQAALFTNLRYGGNNQWCYEEDIYNTEEMTKMVAEWNAAKRAVASGDSVTECSDDTTTVVTATDEGGPKVCGGEQCRELNWMMTRTTDIPLCCTEDHKCGVQLIGCMPMDAPGVPDEDCPDSSMSGMLPVDGCCNPANQCGVVLNLLNLGCVENSTASKIVRAPDLAAQTCGDAPATDGGI